MKMKFDVGDRVVLRSLAAMGHQGTVIGRCRFGLVKLWIVRLDDLWVGNRIVKVTTRDLRLVERTHA